MEALVTKSFIDPVKELLVNRKQTLAVAESVTAGILQAMFSAATEASMFLQGGITVYNLGQKVKHLNIEPIYAEECNCVSEKTSVEMAKGVCRLFNSDWGIGITGYASPMPESGNELFAYCAIACNEAILVNEKLTPVAKEFFQVQVEYARRSVEMLKGILLR